MSKTKYITTTAIGIALYVALSMTAKIPLIGHISLDLGYIVLAVYCYHFGAVSGAIVGAMGCMLVSMITTGMFPIGWMVGNLVIGLNCGLWLHDDCNGRHIGKVLLMAWCCVWVFAGIFGLKTVIECYLYDIPFFVKLPKNAVAAVIDSIVMCIGVLIAPKIKLNKEMQVSK